MKGQKQQLKSMLTYVHEQQFVVLVKRACTCCTYLKPPVNLAKFKKFGQLQIVM